MNMFAKKLHDFFTEKKIAHQITGNEQQILLFQQQMEQSTVMFRLALITNVDDQSVCIHLQNFCMVKEPTEKLLLALNEFNRKYRWATFYLDKHNEVIIRCDTLVTPGNVGDLSLQLMLRLINIATDMYPDLMKAVWG